MVDTHKRTKPWSSIPTVEALAELEPDLPLETLIVDNSCVGFVGNADGHPMDNLRFYDTQKLKKSFTVKQRSVSTLLSARCCGYWTHSIWRWLERLGHLGSRVFKSVGYNKKIKKIK